MTGFLRALEALIIKRSPEPAQASPGTVLVIDDDPAFLESLSCLLQDAGFNVMTSPTGKKGLETLHSAPCDIHVVLLDFHMPHYNGEQTLAYVRKLNPNVKVIGLTGMSPKRLPENFRGGVDKLVLKPFKSIDLFESLTSVLRHGTGVMVDQEEEPAIPVPADDPPPGIEPEGAEPIRALNQLVKEGVLKKEELETVTKIFDQRSPAQRKESVRLLRHLHELHQSNLLSLSEFDMKKWDVLLKTENP